ncbi:diguanylate cyclase [Niameybacter massiliensis]|uniref:Diguanylate cyclase n=1 Tax=Holtiella tumoricola TaxID=3018743 RepID=A0AA42DQ16_9FIRM|nr:MULTISPECIES: diguanylate cyclase [Lachnospirales]MDA3732673.1 diguanylate cyclase [Holtiella tumoricola]
MKITRIKADIYAGISLMIIFTFILLLTTGIQRADFIVYYFMGALCIGSIISYYTGFGVALCLSMIGDFIYGTILLAMIHQSQGVVTFFEASGFIILPAFYLSIGALGQAINNLQKFNKQLNLQKQMLVRIDELTGLKNTSAFLEHLKMYMKLCSRQELPLTVMIVKLRYGKRIKGIIGQKAYDELQKQIGKAIISTLREEDATYSLREEESFASILVMDETYQEVIRERIKQQITELEFDETSPLKGIEIELRIAFKQYHEGIASPLEYIEQVNRELEYDV